MDQPPTFADFAGRHAGAVAWLFGAGPSLDAFLAVRPFIPAEDLIVGVNELPYILAAHGIECSYGFAADPVDRYGHALPADMPLFLNDCAVGESKIGNRQSPLDILVPPGPARGTVILAARVLQHMGVSQIICVGLDGGPHRAGQPWISPPSLCRRAYTTIRALFVAHCERAALDVSFWQPPIGFMPPVHTGSRLADFLDAHPRSLGILFGKGTSLDAFLEGRHPIASFFPPPERLICAFLNDTIAHRAEINSALARAMGCFDDRFDDPPAYAFANDSIAPFVAAYPEKGVVLFQPRRTVNDPSMAAPAPACARIVFEDSGGDHGRLSLPPADLMARGLVANHGTCDTAAQVLKLMGCDRILAIGCDGLPGRASGLPWLTEIRADHADDYADLRRDFRRVLLALDLPTEFYGEAEILRRAPHQLQPGALRLTRATVFRGQAVDAGAEFTDCTASEIQTLIGANKAEPVYIAAMANAER